MAGARLRRPAAHLDEFSFINRVRATCGADASRVLTGIGDDAAVLKTSGTAPWIATSDLLVEGIHFSLSTTSLQDLGYKAGAANLSDVAAMGAVPHSLLVDLALPSHLPLRQALPFYRGLEAVCRPHHVSVVGGDTSASRHDLFIAITALGRTAGASAVLRQGAATGELLFVTGTIGDSLCGLQLTGLSARARRSLRLSARQQLQLLRRHRRPDARVSMGRELGRRGLATSMIDLSDGLSADLPHLCEASRVGVRLEESALPVSAALRAFAEATGRPVVELALQGGEDYELLFTTTAANRKAVLALSRQLRLPVTEIGQLMPQRFGRQLRSTNGTLRPIPITGYRHFDTASQAPR